MDLIIPKAPEIFYSIAAFVVLYVFLSRFALPPIMQILERREQAIRDSITKAEETRIEAERLLQDYKKQLGEARSEAAQIVEQARKLGENAKAKIEEDAREEAARLLARAREEIEAEKRKALIELTGKVADLSVGAASRVIERALSKEDYARLIDEYIAEVGAPSEN